MRVCVRDAGLTAASVHQGRISPPHHPEAGRNHGDHSSVSVHHVSGYIHSSSAGHLTAGSAPDPPSSFSFLAHYNESEQGSVAARVYARALDRYCNPEDLPLFLEASVDITARFLSYYSIFNHE